MAILQFKNADGNWESFVDYDMLAEIKAGVDELLAGGSHCTHYIIEAGEYTLATSPDVSYIAPGNQITDYFFADIVVLNSTKLSNGYGFLINNGKITLLSTVQWIQGTLNGTDIYKDGAYVDAYSNKYKVFTDTVVSKDFYDWWNANTTKS